MGKANGWRLVEKAGRRSPWVGEAWDPAAQRYVSRSWPTRAGAEAWARDEAARQRIRHQAAQSVASREAQSHGVLWRITEYVADLERQEVSAGHVRDTRAVIEAAARAGIPWLGQSGVVELVEQWLGRLAHRADKPLAPATANRYLATLRAYGRWLWRRGDLPMDPLARARRIRVPKVEKAVFSVEELRLLLSVALDGDRYRDHLVGLVYAGLRVSETAKWERTGDGLAIVVRCGKGRKDRIVPLSGEARLWWPAAPPKALGTKHHGRELVRLCRAAGIDPGDRTPHSLRHTWCALLCATGESLPVVQAWAGHESPATTSHYARSAAQYLGARGWPRGEVQPLAGWSEPRKVSH